MKDGGCARGRVGCRGGYFDTRMDVVKLYLDKVFVEVDKAVLRLPGSLREKVKAYV